MKPTFIFNSKVEMDLHYIAKSIGSPLLMNRFDYFSNFHEYNV